ncbi:hypothetical protein [Clostridium sp.]|uniref:hypothetical protein n=1 Tax=Clostridium sp. TaxID=1506 RepID=UPI003D6C8B0C
MVDIKGLTRKKKIQYIWDYYKIHIIVTIIVLLSIIGFIHGQITKINYEFNLTIIGSNFDVDKIEKFEKTLTPIVIKNGTEKQSARIEIMPVDRLTDGKTQSATQYMQKFQAELSANLIDLLIMSKSDYVAFQKQGMCLKLDNVQGINLSHLKAEELERASDKGVYGIDLQDSKILTEFGVKSDGMILCIPVNTKQKDKAILTAKWILGNN